MLFNVKIFHGKELKIFQNYFYTESPLFGTEIFFSASYSRKFLVWFEIQNFTGK